MTKAIPRNDNIPPRRFLSREEAAAWLGVSVDTFVGAGHPVLRSRAAIEALGRDGHRALRRGY